MRGSTPLCPPRNISEKRKNMKQQVISVTKEQRQFLCKAFNVTKVMVSYALNFHPTQGQSELAKRIRKLALERGGFLMCCAPESEVVHDADGMMRQYFENGMMLDGDKRTGTLALKDEKGEVVLRIENATLVDIEMVQSLAKKACRAGA